MSRLSLPCRLGVALLLASATAVSAQTAPKPAAPKTAPPAAAAPPQAQPDNTYKIEGFRSAKFGMTPEQVRAAAIKDFNIAPASISEFAVPSQQTTDMVVQMDHLDPGPGPVTIHYIFGATKKTLMHINVLWTINGQATTEQRRGVAVGAAQLAAYFQGQTWLPKHAAGAVLAPDKTVLLFLGLDSTGASVEVSAAGVPVEVKDATGPKADAPAGPAQLRLSYSADVQHPDVKTLAPGAF
jgi:hypothetical protein